MLSETLLSKAEKARLEEGSWSDRNTRIDQFGGQTEQSKEKAMQMRKPEVHRWKGGAERGRSSRRGAQLVPRALHAMNAAVCALFISCGASCSLPERSDVKTVEPTGESELVMETAGVSVPGARMVWKTNRQKDHMCC